MVETGVSCQPESGGAFRQLHCLRVELPEHIIVEKQIFLISQLPCCANLALPYWGKIVGDIINLDSEERLLSIEATILDKDDDPICRYTDFIALESGCTGEFEIKVIQYDERAAAYSLAVIETEGL